MNHALAVEVVYAAGPHLVDGTALHLVAPCTAWQAVERSGVIGRNGLDADAIELGIWGRICERGQLLRDRDRVEIYRPLLVDPKEARRQRYRNRRKTP